MKKKIMSSVVFVFFVLSPVSFGMMYREPTDKLGPRQGFSLALKSDNCAVLSSFEWVSTKSRNFLEGEETYTDVLIPQNYREILTIYSEEFDPRMVWQCKNVQKPFMVEVKNHDQQYRVTEVSTGGGSVVYNLDTKISDDVIQTIKASTYPGDVLEENTLVTVVKYFSAPALALFVLYYCRNNPMTLIFFEKKFIGC